MIIWLSKTETEKLLKEQALEAKAVDPDTPLKQLKSQSVTDAVKDVVAGSKTAKAILDYINAAKESLRIACIDQCQDVFTVFDGELFLVYINVGVDVWFAPTGQPPMILPMGLLFMHELGHAKQFVEDPKLYGAMVAMDQKPRYPTEEVEVRRPSKRFPQGEIRRKVVLQSLFSRLHYNAKVEWDNISRHEWPICDELKIPRRTNYTDFQGTEAAAKSARAKRLWNAVRYGIKKVAAERKARATLLPGAGKTITEELIRQLTSQADKSAEAFAALVLLFRSSDYPLSTWEAGAWSAFLDWNSGK